MTKDIPFFGIGKLQIYYKCKNCNEKQVLEEKTVIYFLKRIFPIPFLSKAI